MKKREAVWNGIKANPECDVLILGAGVNGTGLLRDLALQGGRCILIEKDDYAAGASSKSSRMIHGGLRYLENAEFKLVSEAVHERNLLLQHAPHYVMPLRTTIPVTSWFKGMIKSPMVFFGLPVTPGGRGALIVKMGLTFYDVITGRSRQTPRHFFMSKAKTSAEVPGLKDEMVCSATYWDAWISQPERLCVNMVREGCQENSECAALNYVTAERVDTEHVRLRDKISGDAVDVKPRIVVNATGAWVDYANRRLGINSQFMGGTKGSHLVIDNQGLYDALGDRMVYYEHDDGRICITFRFMDKVIMGSTDIRVENPDDAVCDDSEIDYMMTTLKGVFLHLNLSKDDIVHTFCGVRPLPFSGLDYTGRVPRSHHLRTSKPDDQRSFPVYSMVGGKLTTFRAFAEQVTDKLLKELDRDRKQSTRKKDYYGAESFPHGADERSKWIERVSRNNGLDEESVNNLLERYGTKAEELAASLEQEWRDPLKSLPEYTVGEIRMIAETEQVLHLSDLVRRRTLITLLGQSNEAALTEIATIIGNVLGWDEDKKQMEIEAAMEEANGRA
ncbi:MAG: glycerol-3-phosphate dehydrogenase/oxidase [Kiritimatiellae bacterium]|jgi:glycerol-3-phosphate dehydrogenase|nr:glycerol-3-phosphate dehydrogenase/oxidase [Kiritimatiellia bacterium]